MINIGSLRRITTWTVAFAACAMVSTANGQAYKCTDSTGRTTYADTPCDAASKPLKLADDPKGNTTNPQMCAQLLDERRRLVAEADNDAKRGRAEGADNAKHRKSITASYEARCAGISRSEPKSK